VPPKLAAVHQSQGHGVIYAHGNDIHACVQEGGHALAAPELGVPFVDVVVFGEPTRLRDDVIMGGRVKPDDAPPATSRSASSPPASARSSG